MSQTTTDQLREIMLEILPIKTVGIVNPSGLREDQDVNEHKRSRYVARLTAILAAERLDELRLFDNFDDETNCFNDDALHYISRRIEQLKKQAEA